MSKNTAFLLSTIGILIVLALTSFNFQSYLNFHKVLGVQTEVNINPQQVYWEIFLAKNPSYFPGWVELAKIDKANANPLKSFEDLNKARGINPNSQELTNYQ